jgi:glutamyl-tRNA synthetase
VRLGWSHGDQEIFTLDELALLFDIDAINKSASVFNTEKLLWLNQHYIKQDDPARIARLLSHGLGEMGIDPTDGPDLVEVVKVQQERAQTLVEMAEISAFFYRDFEDYEAASARKHLTAVAVAPLQALRERLVALPDWTPEALHAVVQQVSEALQLKMGKVAQPLRVAVVGRAASPGIDVTLHLVGRAACLRRIDRAIDWIGRNAEGAANA